MQHISTLASVYHKPPEAFVKGHTEVTFTIGGLGDDDADESVEESDSDDGKREKIVFQNLITLQKISFSLTGFQYNMFQKKNHYRKLHENFHFVRFRFSLFC